MCLTRITKPLRRAQIAVIKCIERYFLGLVHSNGSKQSRAIVLNRFGLALIGRIAPDRSDADYVRRTRSTKRLRKTSCRDTLLKRSKVCVQACDLRWGAIIQKPGWHQ